MGCWGSANIHGAISIPTHLQKQVDIRFSGVGCGFFHTCGIYLLNNKPSHRNRSKIDLE